MTVTENSFEISDSPMEGGAEANARALAPRGLTPLLVGRTAHIRPTTGLADSEHAKIWLYRALNKSRRPDSNRGPLHYEYIFWDEVGPEQ
jgi:hypothetical protein